MSEVERLIQRLAKPIKITIALIPEEHRVLELEGILAVEGFLKGRGFKLLRNDGGLQGLMMVDFDKIWIEDEGGKRMMGSELRDLFNQMIGINFDFFAKSDKGSLLIEVKSKSSERHLGVVNVDTYNIYRMINEFFPLELFFYIQESGKIYRHRIRDPDSKPEFERSFLRGKEIYFIPKEDLEEVATIESLQRIKLRKEARGIIER